MLTEQNLRELGKTSKEIQEEALLDRMKTISELLAKVDTALEDASSTATGPPGTAASSTRPVTSQRLLTAEWPRPTGERLLTGQRLPTGGNPPGSSAAPPPRTAGSVASRESHGPQTITLAELQQQDRLADSQIQLVTYTGTQSHIAGISSRRKVHARAQRSEMRSLLSWSGD